MHRQFLISWDGSNNTGQFFASHMDYILRAVHLLARRWSIQFPPSFVHIISGGRPLHECMTGRCTPISLLLCKILIGIQCTQIQQQVFIPLRMQYNSTYRKLTKKLKARTP